MNETKLRQISIQHVINGYLLSYQKTNNPYEDIYVFNSFSDLVVFLETEFKREDEINVNPR